MQSVSYQFVRHKFLSKSIATLKLAAADGTKKEGLGRKKRKADLYMKVYIPFSTNYKTDFSVYVVLIWLVLQRQR